MTVVPRETPDIEPAPPRGTVNGAAALAAAPHADTDLPAARPAANRSADRTAPRLVQCVASSSSLKVIFSREMDPKGAEAVKNYIIENPPGRTHQAQAATYSPGTRVVLLSGLNLSLSDPVKVTVRDVRDRHGSPISTRDNSAVYSDVTIWKYVLGFGLPVLLISLLAVVWFSRRDL